MIQNLTDESFTKVCIDSGAGESVCPVDAFPSYEMKKSSKTGLTYTAAGGQSLVNVGEKRPCFETNGVDAWMTFPGDDEGPEAAGCSGKNYGERQPDSFG